MKATFDFTPAYCPNCGAKLFQPVGGAAGLEALRATLEDYHNGQPFTCGCGLAFWYTSPGELRQVDQVRR